MKLSVWLLLILFPLAGFCEIVPEQRAKALAETILQTSYPSRNGGLSLEMVYDGTEHDSRSEDEAPPFYVFNNRNDKGFIVISGEDKAMPVLGYSTEAQFSAEQMPINLYAWFKQMKEQITTLRNDPKAATSEIMHFWKTTSEMNPQHAIVQLKTATWGQEHPYNLYSPVKEDKPCPTGCTNTALAIVMHYHAWPQQGAGTIPAYEYEDENCYFSMPERKLGEEYKWELMPYEYTDDASDEAKEQVARLMADCGTLTNTTYTPDGSGAALYYISMFLPTFMNYDKSIWLAKRSNYRTASWHELLQRELDEKRPIIYSGFDESHAGHCFVLDGYAQNHFYHINWGWEGKCNGFYLLDAMYPSYDEKLNYDFNYYQEALLSVKANENGSYHEQAWYDSYGLNAFSSPVVPHVPFKVYAHEVVIISKEFKSNTITFACWLTDEKGNMKEKISDEKSLEMCCHHVCEIGDLDCKITQPIAANDRIRLYFKSKDTDEWSPVLNKDLITDEIIIYDESGDIGLFDKKISMDFNRVSGVLTLSGLTPEMKVRVIDYNQIDITDLFERQDSTFSIHTGKSKRKYYRFFLQEGNSKQMFIIQLI